MNYRLIKSEPYKYSRDQLLQDGSTMRDGIRNYQARNNLRDMCVGDLCFWYHSNEGKQIVGIAQITRESYPDPTVDILDKEHRKGRVVVDVIPYQTFVHPISLTQIKSDPNLSSISLLRQQRLSVAPITSQQRDYIVALGGL